MTAALLPASSSTGASGPTSEPELAVGPGQAKIQHVRRSAAVPTARSVITADHPVVVGLTMLGADGASLSSAIPDPSSRRLSDAMAARIGDRGA